MSRRYFLNVPCPMPSGTLLPYAKEGVEYEFHSDIVPLTTVIYRGHANDSNDTTRVEAKIEYGHLLRYSSGQDASSVQTVGPAALIYAFAPGDNAVIYYGEPGQTLQQFRIELGRQFELPPT